MQTHKKEIMTFDTLQVSNIQITKQSNVQTYKQNKVRSKLERNKESQAMKYITNSKIKQPKTL